MSISFDRINSDLPAGKAGEFSVSEYRRFSKSVISDNQVNWYTQSMIGSTITKIALFLFFFLVFCLATRTYWTLAHTFTPDFSVYNQAAKNMLGAVSAYTGPTAFTLFAYPLVTALFFIPFSFLPYQTAQTIFLTFNFFALLSIAFIIPLIISGKKLLLFSALIFSFSYLSFPAKFTLGMGQVNLIAYILLLISIYMFQKKKIIWIAFFFALACVLKPILGFLLLFWVFQKQWKVIGFCLLFFLLSFTVSILIDHHGIQDYFYYIQHVVPEISRPVGKEIYYNQGFMSFIFRVIPSMQWRLTTSYVGILSLLSIGLFSVIKNKNSLYRFSVLLSLLPLLDTVSWQHHFIILIFPFAYSCYIFFEQKMWYQFLLVVGAYILVSWNFAHPESLTHFPESLLLSNTFYGGLMLFGLLIWYRKVFLKRVSGKTK